MQAAAVLRRFEQFDREVDQEFCSCTPARGQVKMSLEVVNGNDPYVALKHVKSVWICSGCRKVANIEYS